MNSWIFLLWGLIPFVILWTSRQTAKRVFAVKKHLKNQRTKGKGGFAKMLALIEQFVGKKCEIQTIEKAYTGVIESVEENWIVVQDTWYETKEIINLEYVTGIRLYKQKIKKVRKEKQEA